MYNITKTLVSLASIAFISAVNAKLDHKQKNNQLITCPEFNSGNSKTKNTMDNQNFTTSILVDQSPAEVFKAINNPRAWWSETIEGSTNKVNDEWNYHFEDNHRSKIKVIEMIPGKKVVWLVEENYFKFTKDKSEWTGNKITFDIFKQGSQTQLIFTQIGLVPSYECYNACSSAWSGFIQKSLKSLISTGKGQLKWYLQDSK